MKNNKMIDLNTYYDARLDTDNKEPIRIKAKGDMVSLRWKEEKVTYSMPAREFISCAEMDEFHCPYGYIYPISYITLYGKTRGVTIIASEPHFDSIHIYRNEDDIRVDFIYDNLISDTREFLIYFHEPDFKKGYSYYKIWYQNKYGGKQGLSCELSDIYRMRRCFIHEDLCSEHALSSDGTLDLLKIRKQDTEKIGGFDSMLLFDLGYDPETKIRCGNKEPFFLNKVQIENLNQQIDQMNIPTFLYFDPYLIDAGSDWDHLYHDILPMKDRNQEIIRNWGESRWHPCISQTIYEKESLTYLEDLAAHIHADGIYLDEMGNGNQYQCSHMDHGHDSHFKQVEAEKKYTIYLREVLNDRRKVWMSEYPPADSYAHLYDIVLSDTRTPLNIYRFIFPEKKFIRIIGCDLPLGDNTIDVNKSFFNGEGLWIDGDTADTNWYPEHICQVIREQYAILKKYSKQFSSMDVVPLVDCQSDHILCNRFSKDGYTILTFLNISEMDSTAILPSFANTQIENLYHGILDHKNDRYILQLKAGDAGCVLLKESLKAL